MFQSFSNFLTISFLYRIKNQWILLPNRHISISISIHISYILSRTSLIYSTRAWNSLRSSGCRMCFSKRRWNRRTILSHCEWERPSGTVLAVVLKNNLGDETCKQQSILNIMKPTWIKERKKEGMNERKDLPKLSSFSNNYLL